MNRRALRAAAVGLALTAIVPDVTSAADLPMKAPPKPADFNPFWAEADYLAWSVTGDKLPALVTTSPVGTPLGAVGVLGQPTTTVLFGNSSVNNDWRSGGRITAGYWFDPQRSRGIEASFFGLENLSTGFATDTNANPILARPFTNALTGFPDALIAGFPGLATGSASASETSRLLGAGALYRWDLGAWSGQRVSALVGALRACRYPFDALGGIFRKVPEHTTHVGVLLR